MKKRHLSLLLILSLIMLSFGGCSRKEQSNQSLSDSSKSQSSSDIPVSDTSEKSPIDEYKSFLQNKATFFSVDANENIYINEIKKAVSSDDSVKAYVSKFAILDMEGDNIPEIILQLTVNDNEYYGYEVLSYKDGVVYGYTMWYRTFMELKEDGTFSFSGGASDYGFGTVQFTDKGYIIDKITYCESVYNPDNTQGISYIVNRESATEEEFNAAIDKQNEKNNATWYDFTDENILNYLR